MGARLQTRIERIEEINAPVLKLISIRQQTCDRFKISIRHDIDYAMQFNAYLGGSADRETMENDLLTSLVLSVMEYEIRFPHAGISRERTVDSLIYATVRMTREFYGREITFDEAKKEIEMMEQAEADLQAGVPADESEAARYFRDVFAQYPRLRLESDSMAAYLRGADVRTL